jgi:hypothetical protein
MGAGCEWIKSRRQARAGRKSAVLDDVPKVPVPVAPRVIAQIVVAITDGGQVLVRGSIDDVVLAYGMLDAAKDAIRDHHQKAQGSPLLLPASARVGRKPSPPAPATPPAQDKPADGAGDGL